MATLKDMDIHQLIEHCNNISQLLFKISKDTLHPMFLNPQSIKICQMLVDRIECAEVLIYDMNMKVKADQCDINRSKRKEFRVNYSQYYCSLVSSNL